ncbi:electron transfer flavoprotein subunit beta, partial [Clostridioides difficile]
VTYVQDSNRRKDIIVKDNRRWIRINKSKYTCTLTAVKELNTPRYMSVDKIVKAYKHDVKVWTIDVRM